MINAISAADIAFIMSSSQELIECSPLITFFIESLMYNNDDIFVATVTERRHGPTV